ncbi:MAG: hypothetical protein V1831_02975 [Candidatus Woesearchaeota archaeon]
MPEKAALSELGQIGTEILKTDIKDKLEDSIVNGFRETTTEMGIKLTSQINTNHYFLHIYDLKKEGDMEIFEKDLIRAARNMERDNISLLRAESQYKSPKGEVAYIYCKQNQA